ncbi:protein kinase domain-containing protein [Glaciihabitans arcticus]|nr:protein kinase [Glaciihabitans arcticus]
MSQLAVSAVRPGSVVGGFSLVRKLGEGAAAEVFLGFAGSGAAPLTSAVKVYRAGGRAGDREVEALGRIAHPHVVRLRDIASGPSGEQCLLLERLELGSLATLLAERSTLSAGEAVTILAPIAAALDVLHTSGVAHGAVSSSRVLFRATGAPVLAGFARCTLFAPDLTVAILAERADVRADRAALAGVVRVVLERAGVSSFDWLDAVQAEGFPDPLGEELVERLFTLADSSPVRFGADVSQPQLVPARAVAPTGAVDELQPRSALVGGLGIPAWLLETLDGSPFARAREKLTGALRGVRRPLWWVFGAVGAALVAALVLVPQGSGERVASRAAPTETPIAIDQGAVGPVTADDPVAALVALLQARERCLRDLSVLCLDQVLEPGSSALDADAAIIRELQAGGETRDDSTLEASAPALVERLGDSALVSLGADGTGTDTAGADSKPASVLLMKGEAGWRIRGYVGTADG